MGVFCTLILFTAAYYQGVGLLLSFSSTLPTQPTPFSKTIETRLSVSRNSDMTAISITDFFVIYYFDDVIYIVIYHNLQ